MMASELLLAVSSGDLDSVRKLLKHGASANLVGDYGRTPLHIATEKGFVEIAEALLQHDASVDAVCEKREHVFFTPRPFTDPKLTPLCLAIEQGHASSVKLLLKHGADVRRESNGASPLFTAIFNGREEVVSALLDFEPGLQPMSLYIGVTPLHVAARLNNHAICKLLLERGASVNDKCCKGKTGLFYAVSKDKHLGEEIDRMMLDCPNLRQLSTYGHSDGDAFKVIQVLLENGSEVNTVVAYQPVLHAAIENKECVSAESIEMLIEYGADIDDDAVYFSEDGEVEEFSKNALIEAIEHKRSDIIKILIDSGANVNAWDSVMYRSMLHHVVSSDFPEVIELFVEAGADLDKVETWNGYTALDLAIALKRLGCVEALLEFGADFDHFLDFPAGVSIFTLTVHNAINMSQIGLGFSFSGILPLLVRDIVMKRALNMYVSKDNLETFESYFLESLKNACEAEVAGMKTETIGDSCTCYWTILTESKENLVKRFRNTSIVKCLNSGSYAMKYPMYASAIKRKFEATNKRGNLLDLAEKMFRDHIFDLIDVCSAIFDLLSNGDLCAFVKVWQPSYC